MTNEKTWKELDAEELTHGLKKLREERKEKISKLINKINKKWIDIVGTSLSNDDHLEVIEDIATTFYDHENDTSYAISLSEDIVESHLTSCNEEIVELKKYANDFKRFWKDIKEKKVRI